MRVLLVMLLAGSWGCIVQGRSSGDDSGGWSFPGGTPEGKCQSDSACSDGDVCARSGACLPPSQVHPVHVTWTLRGMPASRTTCGGTLDLQISFAMDAGIDDLAYAPVPCIEGKFTVDKLPNWYTQTRLGRATSNPAWQSAKIDGVTGDAMLDLPF